MDQVSRSPIAYTTSCATMICSEGTYAQTRMHIHPIYPSIDPCIHNFIYIFSTGTCVPICYASFLMRLFGMQDTHIIFVESFCRVKRLSLTGKLLYPIADRFFVQWEDLSDSYPRAEFAGVLS
jgi:hypothetical protein